MSAERCKPDIYPVCWEAGFGWGWAGFWRLMFPRIRLIPGYDVLPVPASPWWMWPIRMARRFNWAVRGPV